MGQFVIASQGRRSRVRAFPVEFNLTIGKREIGEQCPAGIQTVTIHAAENGKRTERKLRTKFQQ